MGGGTINVIFGLLIISSILVAAFNGNINSITAEAITAAGSAVTLVIKLTGILTLWLGIAKIAERSGLLNIFTSILHPFVSWLFPSIPRGHPAMGSILMNYSANLFGLGSAATPFGLKAMEELQKLNRTTRASEAMCTFLAINTSSITLIPSTIIAIRINAGSSNPMEIIGTMLFATTVSTLTALTADYYCRTRARNRGIY